MSKRTTIFLSLLALVTTLLSFLFILVNTFVDITTSNESVEIAFKYIRTAFDLIAEYTAYGILIYAFSRYSFKKAIPSIFISLGSFLFSTTYLLIFTGIKEYFEKSLTAQQFWLDRLFDTGVALIGLVAERILPCVLIIFITFLCTRKGTKRISKLISFKNPIQKSMLFSSLLIYIVNIFPYLIECILLLISIGGTQEMYFEEFYNLIILPNIVYLVNHLFLVYITVFIVFLICKKHEEKAPIKKAPKIADTSEQNNTPLEEK